MTNSKYHRTAIKFMQAMLPSALNQLLTTLTTPARIDFYIYIVPNAFVRDSMILLGSRASEEGDLRGLRQDSPRIPLGERGSVVSSPENSDNLTLLVQDLAAQILVNRSTKREGERRGFEVERDGDTPAQDSLIPSDRLSVLLVTLELNRNRGISGVAGGLRSGNGAGSGHKRQDDSGKMHLEGYCDVVLVVGGEYKK